MNALRAIILIGQLGKIWSISSTNKKLFQSISTVGYFYLMEYLNNRNSQVFTIGDTSTEVIKAEVEYKKVTFNKKPW
jgi:hypothetical protein